MTEKNKFQWMKQENVENTKKMTTWCEQETNMENAIKPGCKYLKCHNGMFPKFAPEQSNVKKFC